MKILWKRIQKDDKQAFNSLFNSSYKKLCVYIVQFTKNMDDAEDIVQEVFVDIWLKRHSINIHSSIKSYLYRATYNSYVDRVRKEQRNNLFLIELKHQALQTQIEDKNDSEQKVQKIKMIVEQLPQKCKQIFLLSKSEGLKNKEIAISLNISIKTVESQMRIAFQKIRSKY
jgi:RNA polymerase sigma-70 factor (ECF subfamily)